MGSKPQARHGIRVVAHPDFLVFSLRPLFGIFCRIDVDPATPATAQSHKSPTAFLPWSSLKVLALDALYSLVAGR